MVRNRAGAKKKNMQIKIRARSVLLFTPAPCTCCMASEQAPKCVLFSILCASIVAIHTEIVVSICEIWRKCEL